MAKRLLYFILFFMVSVDNIAQVIDEKEFTYYGLKEGLSDKYISGIEQDTAGYMWIATHRGLNRFDGKIFKKFYHDDKYNAIPDNSIYSMKLLNNNQLAIATDDGAQLISTKTLEQKNLSIATDDKLRYWSNACRSVLNDADGNYGVSTKTGFYIFSRSGLLKQRYDYYTRKDIGKAWMLFGDDIYILPDGNVMQLNKDGLLVYDRIRNKIIDASIKYKILKKIIQEKNNNIFFFISGHELIHINIATNSFDLVDIIKGTTRSSPACFNFKENIGWMTNPIKINDSTWAINCNSKGFYLLTINPGAKNLYCSSKKYFENKLCTIFFCDQNKNLWIGTNEGLFKQNSHPKLVESFALENQIPKDINITALQITDKKIFAGTDRNTLFVLDKETRKVIRQVQLGISSKVSNTVYNFYLFHPDTLWIGTSSGLYWLNLRNFSTAKIKLDKKIENPFIYLLFADKKKNIWVSILEGNTIYYYDRKAKIFQMINDSTQPLFKTTPTSIAEDRNGNIWMGGDAIVRWNYLAQRIDTLIDHLPTQRNLKKGYHVMADSKGNIWTTVTDDGIAKLTGGDLHIRPKNLVQEKSSYVSPGLLQDNIFILTSTGPGYFDIDKSKSVTFNTSDGVPEELLSTFFFTADTTDGSVWFACKNVICKIPIKSSIDYINPPVLNITALSILNDTIINNPSQKINLNYKQGDVNIFYSAINYTDPENMRYSYRIKNKKDSSWIEAGDQQNILLTNISPGSYKLELMVAAYDNKWDDQIKELEINVLAPFWQTPIFYILVALILVMIAYYLYRYRIKQINQRANLDRLLAQAEMKALHSQMNPHFIFNCLNSIREMILINENDQASRYLSKFARLIRITLNQSSKTFVSLEDTIDYLHRYLEMEQIRKNNFSYSIDVDGELHPGEILLPPMLIQPFIENAIWHGASPKKDMQIEIGFQKKGDELICIIEDNGIGINKSLKKKETLPGEQSVGIINIRQRIALLNEKYNLSSTVKIEDKTDLSPATESGTIVTLHLSIQNNKTPWND
ncbi:MAG: histidine kinase [Chitinophagaceae bacterium]